MLNVLCKYLVLNDNVGIPGIGNFTVKRTASQSNGFTFYPPMHEIAFQPGSALTDKNFYHFLALEKNISEVDAVRKFQDFAYQLRKDIQSYPFVELSGLGVLKRNNTGELYFESAVVSNKYFPVLSPEEIASPVEEPVSDQVEQEIYSEEEAPVKKDRWWIWATVLALLALAAIGYFYMQEESF
jgi:nucleoid DNA-binding protein